MDAETIEKLDAMEEKLLAKLDYQTRNGYYSDSANTSQTLVNIATYRRLPGGRQDEGEARRRPRHGIAMRRGLPAEIARPVPLGMITVLVVGGLGCAAG